MTVEATIKTALNALVGGRVYADFGPDNAQAPFITFTQVGGAAINFVDPTAPDVKTGRFQVNVWARTREEAATLSRSVEDTLRGSDALQTTVLEAPVALYDEETRLRGTRQDFSFWFAS